MTHEITLQTLLPYTDFMTDVEVLRFTAYIGNNEPFAPFTQQEIAELEERKERHFQKLKQKQEVEKYLQQAFYGH